MADLERKVTDKEENKDRPHFKGGKGKGTKFKSRGRERYITDGSNDVHWYGNDEVIKLAANYSFFKALGLPINNIYTYNIVGYRPGAIPGIMAIHIMDALPVSTSQQAVDAINVAARQQYALIRKANSGSKNYEWNDLIVYELARSSLNEIYAFIARAYGVACKYSLENRYLPKAILKAMGFDADDFISNLASIRLWLNNFALKINTLALPHSLTYFERKAWLYSNLYVDEDVTKAQVYFFTPASSGEGDACFWMYDATASSNGGCLIRKPLFAAGGNTFTLWKVQADLFADRLLTDDDSAIISGDILKAYGESSLFKCNMIPEDFSASISHNKEVLSQIENLTTAASAVPKKQTQDTGDDILLAEGAVTQDGNGNLLFRPKFETPITSSVDINLMDINPLLNFHDTNVTPDMVMVGTRLTTTFGNAGSDSQSGKYFTTPKQCCSEIVTKLNVIRDPAGTYTTDIYSIRATGNSGTSVMGVLQEMLDLANFDWAPKMYVVDQVSSQFLEPFGDLSVYRVISQEELGKLHDTAILYMLGVPLIDSYNK